MRIFLTVLAAIAGLGAAPKPAPVTDGVARAFPHEAGVVDLMVTGPAAKQLYDRLPGKGQRDECAAVGLLKGGGKISCAKGDDGDYVCHVWLNVPKQTLAPPEDDDC
jgi:hypothetical protein